MVSVMTRSLMRRLPRAIISVLTLVAATCSSTSIATRETLNSTTHVSIPIGNYYIKCVEPGHKMEGSYVGMVSKFGALKRNIKAFGKSPKFYAAIAAAVAAASAILLFIKIYNTLAMSYALTSAIVSTLLFGILASIGVIATSPIFVMIHIPAQIYQKYHLLQLKKEEKDKILWTVSERPDSWSNDSVMAYAMNLEVFLKFKTDDEMAKRFKDAGRGKKRKATRHPIVGINAMNDVYDVDSLSTEELYDRQYTVYLQDIYSEPAFMVADSDGDVEFESSEKERIAVQFIPAE